MFPFLKYLLAATILFPATLACFRLRSVSGAYWPFLVCLILAAINEIASSVLSHLGISAVYLFRTYSLLESILLFTQFMLWRSLKLFGPAMLTGVALISLLYIICIMVISTATAESVFMIAYGILLIALSLREINHQLIITTTSLARNANLLIAVALLAFYTYAVLIEVFWWYGLDDQQGLSARIYEIIPVINVFVNFTFAYAILWIPRKPKFILQ